MSKNIVLRGVANYMYVFKPRKDESGDDDAASKEPRYECTLSFDKDAPMLDLAGKPLKDGTTQKEAIDAAVLAVAEEKFGDKAASMIKKGTLEIAIKDGDDLDEDSKDFENFANCWTITARRNESLGQPGVVDQDVERIIDQTEIYSGCEINMSMSVFYYYYPRNKPESKAMKRGISFGLNHVQKVADGERRGGGGTRIEDDFRPLAGAKKGNKPKGKPKSDDDDDENPFG